jgi:hypothetical protein
MPPTKRGLVRPRSGFQKGTRRLGEEGASASRRHGAGLLPLACGLRLTYLEPNDGEVGGLLNKCLGNQCTVTLFVLALIAKKCNDLAVKQSGHMPQRFGTSTVVQDSPELIPGSAVAGADAVAILLGIAKLAQVKISDASCFERGRKSSLRQARFARNGVEPHVDKHINSLLMQARDQCVDGAAFVADAHQARLPHMSVRSVGRESARYRVLVLWHATALFR